MKIRQLHFKNINNLKGEHKISFDAMPLSQAGIFAIVGPTGSGKSTILDVITLALFNRIPRFKKAISKNEIANEGSVLTHHTTEAFATIDYEIKGETFRSSWSMSTNRNGKLRDYEMSLFNPDGKAADLKKSEVPLQNEKIIGLNYDQFIKSILLSQGEFSKFLKADKNERGKLLEKITGTSIYRNIGINTYQKYKEVKERLELEKEKIGEISTFSDDERKELLQEKEKSVAEKEQLESILKTDNEVKQLKIEIESINKSLAQKKKENLEIKDQVERFKSDQQRLDLNQKLSPVQGDLALYNQAHAGISKSQENLKRYKTELGNHQKQYADTISALATLTKENVDEENFKRVMNDFETEINNADRDLENLKNNGKEARQRINAQIEHYPIHIGNDVKPDEAITLLQQRKNEINEIVKKSNLDTTLKQSELRTQLKQKQEELNALKEVHEKYKVLDDLGLKLIDYQKELDNLESIKKLKTPLVDKSQQVIKATSQTIELLFKQKEDAVKIAKLEDLRDTLEDDQPCPLCGAMDHPYSAHRPKDNKNEIDEGIKKAQKELEDQQLELEALRSDLTKCTTSIDHNRRLISETTKQIATKTTETNKIIAKAKDTGLFEQTIIVDSIDQLSKFNSLTEKAIDAFDELKKNKDLITGYNDLHEEIKKYSELKKKRFEKFDGPNVNAITNKLQDDFESSKTSIARLKTSIEIDSEKLKEDNAILNSIMENLNPKIKELGFENISEINAHLLDENTVSTLAKRRDHINNNKTRISTEIKNLSSELKKKTSADTKPDLSLNELMANMETQTNSLNHHNETVIRIQEKIKRDDEDRERVKKKEKAIDILNQEFEKWSLLNKMIGDAQGTKFSNFAQGLTLQNLLVYANQRLTNLSDRYLLDKPENDGALIVIDKYQGNTSRSVTTLSGGESFLISLALALSLSDMASKNVALECLFIDEGFGTLDPDSLELALNTLEKLQSESQKTVGVISHVEALKERIDVQIKLNKNAQGYSQIEVS